MGAFLNISIHVLREEDDFKHIGFTSTYIHISIHVLREEDDRAQFRTDNRKAISIHVLREEDDSRS